MTCVTCHRVSQGPLCGRHWALWVRGMPMDSQESVCAIMGCPKPHWSGGFCRAHHARRSRGHDLLAPIHPMKCKGITYAPEPTGEPMGALLRSEESETLWAVVGPPEARAGGVRTRESNQTELGTPEMWQAETDKALKRAWEDLESGRHETRLRARLADWQTLRQPKAIQSPLLATVKLESQPEREQRTA